MNTTQSLARLESQIAAIQKKLLAVGPIHPGSLSRQYQVCGHSGCRCMDPDHPQRHGPYHKLAYVHRGKPVCRFVRTACVATFKKRLAAYKRFRSLIDQWIAISIQQGTLTFFSQPPSGVAQNRRKIHPARNKPMPR